MDQIPTWDKTLLLIVI